MGNKPLLGFCGDDDVTLTININAMSEDEFAEFIREADEKGMFEASEYKDKAALCAALSTFKESDKKAVLENLKQGKRPFDD